MKRHIKGVLTQFLPNPTKTLEPEPHSGLHNPQAQAWYNLTQQWNSLRPISNQTTYVLF